MAPGNCVDFHCDSGAWHLSSRFGDLNNRVTSEVGTLNNRITKVESAIKALGSKQDQQTKDLVKDLLSAARTTDDPQMARNGLRAASAILVTLKKTEEPADAEYFREVVALLDEIPKKSTSAAAHTVRVKLAEYRSSAESAGAGTEIIFTNRDHGLVLENNRHVVIKNGSLDFSRVAGDAIVLKDSPDVTFLNMVIKGGSVTLDGIHWQNVTFIGTRIRYKDGWIDLQGVHFANCTFDIPPSPQGKELLNFAALGLDSLKVG